MLHRIMATQVSKKRKFCADGVFKAELNEMLMRELAEDGYELLIVVPSPSSAQQVVIFCCD